MKAWPDLGITTPPPADLPPSLACSSILSLTKEEKIFSQVVQMHSCPDGPAVGHKEVARTCCRCIKMPGPVSPCGPKRNINSVDFMTTEN